MGYACRLALGLRFKQQPQDPITSVTRTGLRIGYLFMIVPLAIASQREDLLSPLRCPLLPTHFHSRINSPVPSFSEFLQGQFPLRFLEFISNENVVDDQFSMFGMRIRNDREICR
jgi:hypothetical protein